MKQINHSEGGKNFDDILIIPKSYQQISVKKLFIKKTGFANTTQTFFDKQGFQKLEKNLKKIHMYSDKLANRFWLKKITSLGFLLNNFFSTILLTTFWNY